MNIVIIFLIIIAFFYLLFSKKESFSNESYYIDASGKHYINKLPIQLNNIKELKYTTTSSSHVKFVTTRGSYNNLSTENEMTIINGKPSIYQSIHLQNKYVPFSGTLF
jgi:hypothetical protein